MAMTPEEYRWFEDRFREVREIMAGKDVVINGLDSRVTKIEVGSVHTCTEAVQKHEAKSWSHNPYKAAGLLAGILGAVESAKKFFHS